MGKHLWVSEDPFLSFDERSWITTAIVFHGIFDRVANFFLPEEVLCKENCYAERGMDGIDLREVDKDCFNVFYLRCKMAFDHFPDEKWLCYEGTHAERRGAYEHVLWEWAEILKRLRNDKRYDPEWVESYRSEMLSKLSNPSASP